LCDLCRLTWLSAVCISWFQRPLTLLLFWLFLVNLRHCIIPLYSSHCYTGSYLVFHLLIDFLCGLLWLIINLVFRLVSCFEYLVILTTIMCLLASSLTLRQRLAFVSCARAVLGVFSRFGHVFCRWAYCLLDASCVCWFLWYAYTRSLVAFIAAGPLYHYVHCGPSFQDISSCHCSHCMLVCCRQHISNWYHSLGLGVVVYHNGTTWCSNCLDYGFVLVTFLVSDFVIFIPLFLSELSLPHTDAIHHPSSLQMRSILEQANFSRCIH